MLMSEKNERSRTHAAAALDAYRAAHTPAADGSPRKAEADDAGAIADLIVDLLHLAEARGVLPSEMGSVTATALDHYEHEADPDHADEQV